MDTDVAFHWKHLVHLLQCPRDRGGLVFTDGYLACQNGHRYPVIRGIPRFVDKQFYSGSFGYEWNRWPRVQFESENIGQPMEGHTRKMFRGITRWSSDQLHGNSVVEFGCGSGRFLDIACESGATVVGLDLSSAVEAARMNFKDNPDVLIVQGDVLHPPVRDGAFDKAYSIGVLHHTPDPAAGVRAMAGTVREGGSVAVRVYGVRGFYGFPSVRWHRATFRALTSVAGPARAQQLATAYAHVVSHILHPLFVVLRRIPVFGRVAAHTIERFFIVHPNLPDARWRELDTFDAITPHHASTHTRDEVASWFAAAGLHDIHRTSGETTFVGTKSEPATPLVSVVMSVKDGAAFLRESVDSILQQSLTDFEFIIVNDGSSDATEAILSSYTDPRIRLMQHQASRGLAASLNEGIIQARGRFIARMDADDVSKPRRLEHQVAFLLEHPAIGIVGTFATMIRADGSIRGIYRRPTTHRLMQWCALTSNPLIHPSVIARTEVFREHRYNEEYVNAQDFELWSRLFWESNVRFANIPEALLRYRIHDTSTTSLRSIERTERSLGIIVANMERYAEVSNSIRDALTRLRMRRALPLGDACALQVFLTRLALRFSRREHPTVAARLAIAVDLLRIAKQLAKAWVRFLRQPGAGSPRA